MSDYAVIKTGGKQYRVKDGQMLVIEKLDVEPGETVSFNKVLMLNKAGETQWGSPYIEGITVKATVVEQTLCKKIRTIKLKRRKHHMKHLGHRQPCTLVKITDLQGT